MNYTARVYTAIIFTFIILIVLITLQPNLIIDFRSISFNIPNVFFLLFFWTIFFRQPLKRIQFLRGLSWLSVILCITKCASTAYTGYNKYRWKTRMFGKTREIEYYTRLFIYYFSNENRSTDLHSFKTVSLYLYQTRYKV